MKKIINCILRIYYKIYGKMQFFGKNIHVGINCKVVNQGKLEIYDNAKLRKNAFVNINKGALLRIGKNTDIGINSRISVAQNITFGESCLLGPNVYVADHDHSYKDINKPIKDQGAHCEGSITIGDGTWIGINAVIVGPIQIGKNCVIGANAVVTKDIPDYSVVVGVPAKIIKQYDLEKKEWIRV